MARPVFVVGGLVNNSFSATATVSLAIGTGTGRYVLMVGGPNVSGSTPVVSMTFDGTSMGAAIASGTVAGRPVFAYGYAIPDGATGTKAIVLTMTNGDTKPSMACAIWSGVVTTTVGSASTGASSNSHSETITSDATNGLAIALVAASGAGNLWFGSAPTTLRVDNSGGSINEDAIFEKDGGGSTTLNWTSNFADTLWRVAVDLNGGSSTPVGAAASYYSNLIGRN